MNQRDASGRRMPTGFEIINSVCNPGKRYALHISGGRTSAYMLKLFVDVFGGQLLPNVKAIFTNTGKERVETLDFLHELETRWGVDLVWLEYVYRSDAAGGARDPRHAFKIVDYYTASREGQPFEALIKAKKMLPNQAMRFCTVELKIETARRYCNRVLGWDNRDMLSILGIRHDEPARWGKALFEHCKVIYPLVDLGVDEDSVLAYWSGMSFDLQLRPDEGNCDLCFLKGKAKLIRLIRERPESVIWWQKMEQYRKSVDRSGGKPGLMRFRDSYRYEDLERLSHSLLDFGDEDDTGGIDCFCGD